MARVIRRIKRRVPRVTIPSRMSQVVEISPLESRNLEPFNPAILGLGDLNQQAKEIDVIAAMFDLAGFTRFCNQVDPHLAIHSYLRNFLEWLFTRISIGLTLQNLGDRRTLWAELPFFAKFRGDGVLFLWDTWKMDKQVQCRIITVLYEICRAYHREFLPHISTSIDKAPSVLRCGISRGRVFSIGDGKDYVGHCMNIAARLQKAGPVTFCFSHRGFQVADYMPENYKNTFVQKRIAIRGAGENELVWIPREEFNRISDKYIDLFRSPT